MIYLDHSATTPVDPEVAAYIKKTMEECFGNPSSLYDLGIRAEKILRSARRSIGDTLGVSEKEIYFTSCGSEGNNTVLRGIAEARRKRGRHLICSAVEHPSVLRVMDYLEREHGFEVTRVGIDRQGHFDLETLKASLRPDTQICAVMMVNNEIGSIFPLKEIAAVVHEINPDCVFHVDGVQGYGRIPIDLKKTGIDTFVLSGHKFGAPKGIGALYIRKGLRVLPLLYGGGQEQGLRAGTENVPYIAGLDLAAKRCNADRKRKNDLLKEIKNTLIENLKKENVAYIINGDLTCCAPHILNLRFPGIKSEVLLHYLEGKGIYVSQGSACHNNGKKASETLSALGLNPDERDASIRFSFGKETKVEDMAVVAKAVSEGVQMI